MESTKFRDACGVFGIYDRNNNDSADLTYFALMSLQHRGQESAGIAVSNEGAVTCYKDSGLVQESLNDKILSILRSDMSIGHVRYGLRKENGPQYAQPHVAGYKHGNMAVALNGALTNNAVLRKKLEEEGAVFTTNSDCEVISALIAKHFKASVTEAVKLAVRELEGGFSLVILMGGKILGARDRYGIRPLSIGKLLNGYAISSESCAFDIIGAELVCDVNPGEIVVIDSTAPGIHFVNTLDKPQQVKAMCAFEFVYFARPDSVMNGISVHASRERAGRQLAREYPADADCVIGVPDSGIAAAVGYAAESGLPYSLGFVKNRYVGRTFIKPTQAQRELAVKLKLNPIREVVEGKRIVLVDDSIVRGTTSLQIIESLRNAGAKEVHVRIPTPEVKNICPFGIDIPDKGELISAKHSTLEICKMITADSLGFLSSEGILAALESDCGGYCSGCLTGNWPGINM